MLKNGNLKDFNFNDLISIISQTNKNGILEIDTDNIKSFIVFYNGNIINAYNDDLNNEELLFNLSLKEDGTFNFVEKDTSNIEIKINKDIYELIKEISLKKEFIKNLNDLNLYLNSKITLLKNDENYKILEHLKDKNLSILEFFELSKYNVSEFIKLLKNFIDNNIIKIEETNSEVTYSNLLNIANNVYSEFVSISGLKMSNDIEKKIKDLILLNNLNLIIKNGKIYNIELFSYKLDKKIKNLKSFLKELISYSVKIYGNEFIKNISDKLSFNLEALIIDLHKEI
ncbi:MAG: hypothetical protein KatS3mg068_0162 [Candidatus Sericytochromatia bacterium]|nr:MAG: hypothetical protein KatS3mg068_0162 [Candidatus Sericytochromatia bacterium]